MGPSRGCAKKSAKAKAWSEEEEGCPKTALTICHVDAPIEAPCELVDQPRVQRAKVRLQSQCSHSAVTVQGPLAAVSRVPLVLGQPAHSPVL